MEKTHSSSIKPSRNTVLALRDFFLAVNSDDLAAAFALVPGMPNLSRAELIELEYEFNRLFVGPLPPLAPPYASVYLEKEPRLVGRSTQEIGRFYSAIGLCLTKEGTPPDHLGLEMEAWLALKEISAEYTDADFLKAKQFFLNHINEWLPLFIKQIRKNQISPVIKKITDLLEEWLIYEQESL